MKVLHLIQNYHPSVGGSQHLFKNLSERLVADHGDEVTVFTSDALRSPHARDPGRVAVREEWVRGVRVRRFRFSRAVVKASWFLLRSTRWAPRGFRQYLGSLRLGPVSAGMLWAVIQSDADVIAGTALPYAHMYYPWIAQALGRGRPFVCYGALHIVDGTVEAPALALAKRADAYVAYTRFERDVLVAHGVAAEKIEVIGPGVDLESFTSIDGEAVKASLGIEGDLLVGFIGRFAPYKGIDTLLDAMRNVWTEFPEARLLLAGSGDSEFVRACLADLPATCQTRVVFISDFDENDKPGLFAACDVVVTVSSQESFGIVYLEAWAAGKPVIGGRIGAVASVITEGVDGLLVTCGDAAELAAALSRLLGDDALRKRLGSAGREKVADAHTWRGITTKLRSIYERLVDDRLTPSPDLAAPIRMGVRN
ncbi:MAG: glycosyltransferase family 4 protein [Isosphaeraceae bacterium]